MIKVIPHNKEDEEKAKRMEVVVNRVISEEELEVIDKEARRMFTNLLFYGTTEPPKETE
jgi:hypothetical protein